MAEAGDRQALLSTLTTEHFTLQGARASVVGEMGARSSLYLSAVSSALIALGFVAQVSKVGETFRLFALAILPVLFFLGVVTYVRLVEKAIEEFYYARAINRIRGYYLELAGADGRYYLLTGHDDAVGVFENMGLTSSRMQLIFTSASTIAIVNSVVAGAGTALLTEAVTSAAPGLAVACGAAAAVALAVGHLLHERQSFTRAFASMEVLSPSKGATSRVD
jgi:hypothetical protein